MPEFDIEPIPLSYLDTDGTLAANSDTKVATQKAVKTYADQLLAANDAMVFQGVIDCSANPNYPAADAGHTYRVSVAGKIGGASGINVEIGDLLMCLVDSTASGDQATVGSSWSVAQTNLDGAVIGPASVTDSALVRFDGTTGKLIKAGSAIALGSEVSGTLPVASGGTALSSVGLLNQSMHVTSGGALAYATTLPPWYVEDLIFSNGTDAQHDLNNTAGWLVSNDSAFADRVLFQVPALTKRFDVTFAAGTGNGGMKNGTSLANNTWYRVWGVWGAGVTADLVADTGNSAPALSGDLAAYTKIAPAFDFYTDGSANIRAFTHVDDKVTYSGLIAVLSTTTPATSAAALRMACPARNALVEYKNYGLKAAASVSSFCGSTAAFADEKQNFITQSTTVYGVHVDSLHTDSSGNLYYFVSIGSWTAFGYDCAGFHYLKGRE